jgi:prepilin-type processing-associated H-X9-DG protein
MAGVQSRMNAPTLTVLLWEAQGMAFDPATANGNDGPLPDGTGNGVLGSAIGSGWFLPQFTKSDGTVGYGGNTIPSGPSFGERNGSGSGATVGYYLNYTKNARHGKGLNFLAADGHVKWHTSDGVSTGIENTRGDQAQIGNCFTASGCAAGTNNMTLPSGKRAGPDDELALGEIRKERGGASSANRMGVVPIPALASPLVPAIPVATEVSVFRLSDVTARTFVVSLRVSLTVWYREGVVRYINLQTWT